MRSYPKVQDNTLSEVIKVIEYITKERKNDVNDFNNLNKIFISGRKVGKIPTGSSDIASTDRLGDFNFDADYLYLCVDDSGAAWRRVALGVW